MTLTVGSMFSGYGGLELGIERAIDAEAVWNAGDRSGREPRPRAPPA